MSTANKNNSTGPVEQTREPPTPGRNGNTLSILLDKPLEYSRDSVENAIQRTIQLLKYDGEVALFDQDTGYIGVSYESGSFKWYNEESPGVENIPDSPTRLTEDVVRQYLWAHLRGRCAKDATFFVGKPNAFPLENQGIAKRL